MALGALIKGLKTIGIWPLPDPPYNLISFYRLSKDLRMMRSPTLCQLYELDGHNYPLRQCPGAKLHILRCLERAQGQVVGILLDENDDLAKEQD
jgi:hypothetical protein